MMPSVGVLSRHHQRVAAQTRSVGRRAGNGERLPILGEEDPVCRPAAENPCAGAGTEKGLVLAEGQFVDSTDVDDLADVYVTKSIVGSDAHSGNIGGPIAANPVVQHVARVPHALGISVVGEQAE